MSADERISLVRYNERWPRWFQDEADRIRACLGELARGVEHIGSTAVPGLAAKPIVDIMVGLVGFEAFCDRATDLLAALGYEELGGAAGRRYLRYRGERAFNVQLMEHEGELWKANLLFRNYLRANPGEAHRYEAAKRHAAAKAPMLLAYSSMKNDVITELMARAVQWGASIERRGRPAEPSRDVPPR